MGIVVENIDSRLPAPVVALGALALIFMIAALACSILGDIDRMRRSWMEAEAEDAGPQEEYWPAQGRTRAVTHRLDLTETDLRSQWKRGGRDDLHPVPGRRDPFPG